MHTALLSLRNKISIIFHIFICTVDDIQGASDKIQKGEATKTNEINAEMLKDWGKESKELVRDTISMIINHDTQAPYRVEANDGQSNLQEKISSTTNGQHFDPRKTVRQARLVPDTRPKRIQKS